MDFGLDKNMVTRTAVRETLGCAATVLFNMVIYMVSYKADVYSFVYIFRMLLTEIVGLNIDFKRNNQASNQYLLCWIYNWFEIQRYQ